MGKGEICLRIENQNLVSCPEAKKTKMLKKKIKTGTVVLLHEKHRAIVVAPMDRNYLQNNYPRNKGWIMRLIDSQSSYPVAALEEDLIPLGQLPRDVWYLHPKEAIKYLPQRKLRFMSVAFWKLVQRTQKKIRAAREIIFWKLEWPLRKLASQLRETICNTHCNIII